MCTGLSAQHHIMPLFYETPQNTLYNPSIAPSNGGGYLMLPFIGGVSFKYENSGFCYEDAFTRGNGDSLHLDLDKLAGKMKNVTKSLLSTEADITLLGVGFSLGRTFWTFDIINKTRVTATIPKSLLDIRYGNWNYTEDIPIDQSVSELYAKALNYTEFALGTSFPMGKKARFGFRLKLLGGVASALLDHFNIEITTGSSQNQYGINFKTDGLLYAAAPDLTVGYDSDGYVDDISVGDSYDNYLEMNNFGFGADIGLQIKATDRFTIGLAALDLGSIKWKQNIGAFRANNSFTFNGIDVSENIKDPDGTSNDTYWSQLEDSLTQFTDVTHDDQTSFKTPLSTKLLMNMQIDLNYMLMLNLDFGATFVDGSPYCNGGVSGSFHVNNWISLAATMNMNPGWRLAYGFGGLMTLKWFQVYAYSDQFSVLLRKTRGAHLQAGINFLFGQDQKKSKYSRTGRVNYRNRKYHSSQPRLR